MSVNISAAASLSISVGGGPAVSNASTGTSQHSGPAFKSQDVKSSSASDAGPSKIDHSSASSGSGIAMPASKHQVSPFHSGAMVEPKKSAVIHADKHNIHRDNVALAKDHKEHATLWHQTKSDIKTLHKDIAATKHGHVSHNVKTVGLDKHSSSHSHGKTVVDKTTAKHFHKEVAATKGGHISHDVKALASDRHGLFLNHEKTVPDRETKKVDVAKLKADRKAFA